MNGSALRILGDDSGVVHIKPHRADRAPPRAVKTLREHAPTCHGVTPNRLSKVRMRHCNGPLGLGHRKWDPPSSNQEGNRRRRRDDSERHQNTPSASEGDGPRQEDERARRDEEGVKERSARRCHRQNSQCCNGARAGQGERTATHTTSLRPSAAGSGGCEAALTVRTGSQVLWKGLVLDHGRSGCYHVS